MPLTLFYVLWLSLHRPRYRPPETRDPALAFGMCDPFCLKYLFFFLLDSSWSIKIYFSFHCVTALQPCSWLPIFTLHKAAGWLLFLSFQPRYTGQCSFLFLFLPLCLPLHIFPFLVAYKIIFEISTGTSIVPGILPKKERKIAMLTFALSNIFHALTPTRHLLFAISLKYHTHSGS